ncbi:MAG TPA: polysaccharide deacetylase family protein [Draconibacterium sp.]|nr:polysaccharide deacetylase family protein [Draconibacterium sp.]
MAQLPRDVSKQLARFVSASRLFKSKTPVFLPFYHVVSDHSLPHILNYPYRNKKEFELELDYVLKYFKPVSLEELISNPYSNPNIFHLTIDDGLRESHEVIAPILLRKGIPATFFINTGFIDNKDLFHRYKASLILSYLKEFPDSQTELFLKKNALEGKKILHASIRQNDILDEAAEMLEIDFSAFLKNEKPYLTTGQVKDLYKKGFTIGGHSHNHSEFWEMKTKEQLKQVKKSMDWINKHINPKIKAFSFPFTDDGVKKKLLKKIKSENICDITFGTAGLKYDSFDTHFQRVPMEQKQKTEHFLKEEFMYFHLRRIIGKARVEH